jgi:hypothetical protein
MATGYELTMGERMRPAWVAVLGVLDDGEWHTTDELVAAGVRASDVLAVTVYNIVLGGRKHGVLERKGRRGRRWYRRAGS